MWVSLIFWYFYFLSVQKSILRPTSAIYPHDGEYWYSTLCLYLIYKSRPELSYLSSSKEERRVWGERERPRVVSYPDAGERSVQLAVQLGSGQLHSGHIWCGTIFAQTVWVGEIDICMEIIVVTFYCMWLTATLYMQFIWNSKCIWTLDSQRISDRGGNNLRKTIRPEVPH